MWLLQLAFGLAILLTAYVLGPRTGLFWFHVIFPLGIWLSFDALDYRLTARSSLRPSVLKMIALGALFGLVLDFLMIEVTGILRYLAVRDVPMALGLYLGWGFCLPALYESFRVVRYVVPKMRPRPALPAPISNRLLSMSGGIGFLLVAIPLFCYLYLPTRPGILVVSSFSGLWLVMECLIHSRGDKGLLERLLEGHWSLLVALALVSFPLALLWEGLNALMDSWVYQGIFLLEPRILGVPLVAFFGYLCWYVLFLSLNQLSSQDKPEDVW